MITCTYRPRWSLVSSHQDQASARQEGPVRTNLLSKIMSSGSYKKHRSHACTLPPPTPRPLPSPSSWGVTHTGAADEDHAEGLHDACDAHHPGEPQEEDDAKDVLQAREVHTHKGAHAWGLPEKPVSVPAVPVHYGRPTHSSSMLLPLPSDFNTFPSSPPESSSHPSASTIHPSSHFLPAPLHLHLSALTPSPPQPPNPTPLPPSSSPPLEYFPLPSLLPQPFSPRPHLHRLLFSTLIVFRLFVLPTSLGQVGVVGQATEQGGHHGAGVHLLLQRKGVSVLGKLVVSEREWGELDGRGQRTGTGWVKPPKLGEGTGSGNRTEEMMQEEGGGEERG